MALYASSVSIQTLLGAWLPLIDRAVGSKADMQLEFRFESSKAPMELLIVDHVETWSKNWDGATGFRIS